MIKISYSPFDFLKTKITHQMKKKHIISMKLLQHQNLFAENTNKYGHIQQKKKLNVMKDKAIFLIIFRHLKPAITNRFQQIIIM